MRANDNALRARKQESALIAGQIGSALQTLYRPIDSEPLPEVRAVLIERIAVGEAQHGEGNPGAA